MGVEHDVRLHTRLRKWHAIRWPKLCQRPFLPMPGRKLIPNYGVAVVSQFYADLHKMKETDRGDRMGQKGSVKLVT